MQRNSSTTAIIPFDELPDSALIRLHQLIAERVIPFSASSLWRKVKSKEFPTPIKVSDQITAWRLGHIRQWQASLTVWGERPRAPIPDGKEQRTSTPKWTRG